MSGIARKEKVMKCSSIHWDRMEMPPPFSEMSVAHWDRGMEQSSLNPFQSHLLWIL